MRRLADDISESIAARVDIRANDYVPCQLAKVSSHAVELRAATSSTDRVGRFTLPFGVPPVSPCPHGAAIVDLPSPQ